MTNEMTTTSVITLFETDKQQRETFVRDFVARVTEGEIDPVKAHYSLKCMEQIIKGISDDSMYKVTVLDAAEKHGKKFGYMNSEISIREAGVKYDYSKCNDPEYLELVEKLKNLNEAVKEREAWLKNIPSTGINVMIDDELVHITPPSKTSSTTVVVTLK